jgi:tRNA A-37 threonylcarbamoyl transferase component Bud32
MHFDLIQRGPAWRDEYAAELRDPEALLKRQDTVLYKIGRSGRIVGAVDVAGSSLVLKLLDERPLRRVVERLLFGSGARRVAKTIARLDGLGIPVPELVCVLELRGLRLRRKSCVVTRFVPCGRRADEVWKSLPDGQRDGFLLELGRFAGRLHRLGVYPQDCKPANLISAPQGDGWRIVLVDLDRVRFYRELSPHRKQRVLSHVRRSFEPATHAEEQVFQRGYEEGSR